MVFSSLKWTLKYVVSRLVTIHSAHDCYKLPMDIDDDALSEAGLHSSPRTSLDDPPTSMSNAIHVIRLRRIWARMHASTNRLDDGYISQLRVDLDEWLRTAPQLLSRPAALSIFCTGDWYDVNYSGTILQLYRCQLAKDNGAATQELFMECIKAASNVCRIYRRQYIGTSIKYTWATLHCIFLAGLTYLHCLWTSRSARDAIPHAEVIKTCTDCTMVLVAIAEGWNIAAPYRDIFEALASRTMSMVLSGKPAAQVTSQATDVSDDVERDALVDWMADIDGNGFDDLLSGFMDDFATLYDHHAKTGISE